MRCRAAARDGLDATKAAGFAGTNITYPFKQEEIDRASRRGAPKPHRLAQSIPSRFEPQPHTIATISTTRSRNRFRGKSSNSTARRARRSCLLAQVALGVQSAFCPDKISTLRCSSFMTATARARTRAIRSCKGLWRVPLPISIDLADITAAQGVVNTTQLGMHAAFLELRSRHLRFKTSLSAANVISTPIETSSSTAAATVPRARRRSNCVHQAVEAFRLCCSVSADVARCTHVRHGACRT